MKNIKAIFARLREELQRAEGFQIDAGDLLQNLNDDIEQLEASGNEEINLVLDRVKELESRFAATHPVLERTARELADAIAKMGI